MFNTYEQDIAKLEKTVGGLEYDVSYLKRDLEREQKSVASLQGNFSALLDALGLRVKYGPCVVEVEPCVVEVEPVKK